MEQQEWAPANDLERAMADALAEDDGPAYARLLTAASLFIPDLPEPGTEAAQQVSELLPVGTQYVLAYTSPPTLAWAMGVHARGYQQLDFHRLRQRWPDSRHQLAVNAGTPIAVFLPLPAVADLASGTTTLASVAAFQEALMHELSPLIRDACLRELSGVDGPGEPPDGPPVNDLEAELRAAKAAQDSERYLTTLLASDVVMPTSAEVPDPGQIYEDEFPWRVVAPDQTPSIALFSSTAQLRRVAAGEQHRVTMPFVDVLANWPDEEPYAMCVDPGTASELILPPAAVDELLSVFDSVLEQHAGAPER